MTTDDCANFGHVTGLGIHPHDGGGLATQADRLILFNIGRQPFVLSILQTIYCLEVQLTGFNYKKKNNLLPHHKLHRWLPVSNDQPEQSVVLVEKFRVNFSLHH